MPIVLPAGITCFRDDDQGFFTWLVDNPDGYFINSERNPKPRYLVLHHSNCPHFTGNPALHWTNDYIKFCSGDRTTLEAWATERVGGEAAICPTCLG